MPVITKINAPAKGSSVQISLSKTSLAALSVVAADSYYSLSSNWSTIIIEYKSSIGNQKKILYFNASDNLPVANFTVSLRSRDIFQVQSIRINDFDDGFFVINRSSLDTLEFDIDMSMPTPTLNTGYEGFGSTIGLTQVVGVNQDDAQLLVPALPFDFFYFGGNYKNNIRLCSNTYLTFGYASTAFFTSASSPGPAIHMGSGDNSWQRVYWGQITINDKPAFRIRYEGTSNPNGAVGNSNIILQITFLPNQQINVTSGAHGRLSGQSGISNGQGYYPAYTMTSNTSFAMSSNAAGDLWTVQLGKYFT